MKNKIRVILLALGLVGGAAGAAVASDHVAAASSAGCKQTWVYVVSGADRVSGVCLSQSWGPTTFRVGQRCGKTLAIRYSPWTVAPAGKAASAQTDNCKWYDGPGGSKAGWVEWQG